MGISPMPILQSPCIHQRVEVMGNRRRGQDFCGTIVVVVVQMRDWQSYFGRKVRTTTIKSILLCEPETSNFNSSNTTAVPHLPPYLSLDQASGIGRGIRPESDFVVIHTHSRTLLDHLVGPLLPPVVDLPSAPGTLMSAGEYGALIEVQRKEVK